MCSQRIIICNHCPVIIKPYHFISSCRNHRFYSKSHARLKLYSASFHIKVRNFRIFVKMCTYTMSHKISYYTVASFFCIASYCLTDIIQVISCNRIFYSLVKALFSNLYKFLCFFASFAYYMSSGSIRMVSLPDDTCV